MTEYTAAVIKEDVWLYLKVKMVGYVTVAFESYNETTSLVDDFWEQQLISEEVTQEMKDENSKIPSEALSRIAWNVVLDRDLKPTINKDPCLVSARVYLGHTPDASSTQPGAWVMNEMRVPGFDVVQNERVRRIMMHEFYRPKSGGGWELDDAPLWAVLENLTVEQKKLLATYDLSDWKVGDTADRLVSFITIQPKPGPNEKRMHMDMEGGGESVQSNATFMAFNCHGDGDSVSKITLVTYTEHFFVGLNNEKSRYLIKQSKQNGLNPDEWLSRKNTDPPRFFLSAFIPGRKPPQGKPHPSGTIWSHLYDKNGKNVMDNNSIHGMINSSGCWSMFRNYNWPTSTTKKNNFDAIYIRHLRWKNEKDDSIKQRLAVQGHDILNGGPDPSDPIGRRYQVASISKWRGYDINDAYSWFLREVLGILYFSTTIWGTNHTTGIISPDYFNSKTDTSTERLRQEEEFNLSSTDNKYEKTITIPGDAIAVNFFFFKIGKGKIKFLRALKLGAKPAGSVTCSWDLTTFKNKKARPGNYKVLASIVFSSAREEYIKSYGNGDTLSDPPKYIYHYPPGRWFEDKNADPSSDYYKPGDELWVENALGFKTQTAFIKEGLKRIPQGDLKRKTWTDLFFFKDDSINKIRKVPRFYRIKRDDVVIS